jgi:type IV pilus assembly protein PilB
MEFSPKIDKPVLNRFFDRLPPNWFVQSWILPVSEDGDSVKIYITSKTSLNKISEFKLICSKKIQPVSLSEQEFREIIVSIPEFREYQEESRVTNFKKLERKEDSEQVPDSKYADKNIIKTVDYLISEAIRRKASDIHIEPGENDFRIRFRIDGSLIEFQDALIQNSHKINFKGIINRLKIMADLDIAEKRIPQDGRIQVEGGGKIIDIRVSTLPTVYGEKVVLRLLDKSNLQLNLHQLGFDEDELFLFRKAIESPYGIVLVTGPTGSGKTTTLYAALNYLNQPDVNIVTIEDPVEYHLDGINQAQVHEEIHFTFSNALRSFLRQDPDIIMVGEIRDSDTAEIAIRASLTGHLVLSTLHTNDAPTTVARLLDMGVEPFLLGSSLQLIVAQRLVRKICEHCKEESSPSDEEIRKAEMFGIELPERVFTGTGCAKCNHTGYTGRTAIFELLPVDEEVRELIQKGVMGGRLRRYMHKKGLPTLVESGLRKVREGITTLDELFRRIII